VYWYCARTNDRRRYAVAPRANKIIRFGFIGAILGVWYFARRTNIPVLTIADICAAVCPVGIFLVRVANFIKPELWGRPSDLPWAIIFPDVDDQPRHGLCIRKGALKRPGLVAGIFGLGYGAGRILAEFFREPDPELEQLSNGLTMGMVLSVPILVADALLVIHALYFRRDKPSSHVPRM
jgi:phosphatidylglycerol---prolipoprotein diacylglyceryl transferase